MPKRRWTLQWTGPAATFAVTLVIFGALFARFPVLYDTDSYYHLAIARAYDRHGVIDSLPWAQLSLLHEFGDKELLFHILLAPFADTADATAGGRWALALANALVAALLAALSIRAVGPWGLLVAPLIYLGSLDFLSRLVRLRPEILSLVLILAATWCAARKRYLYLFCVSALYTLGYTAFHALLGLCGLWFLQRLWARRDRDWGLLLYPILGACVGLLVHPHFPQNLVVWKVQSFDFFTLKDSLNVGGEIQPQSSRDLLVDNLAWWLGLVVLWRSARRHGSPRDEPMADFLLIATGVFGALFMAMQRFSIYFVPLATLTLLYELRRRGRPLTLTTALPWRGHIPFALAMAAVLMIGAPRAADFAGRLAKSREHLTREQEWSALGQALPPGARVAAEWGSTHLYMFWAPQATFLNVLDPIFMAVPYPDAYRTLRAIFDGREPDVPRALRRGLDSEYIAVSRYHQPPRLLERLAADPRLAPVHSAYTLLYRVVPNANAPFLLDWKILPPGSRLPPASDLDLAKLAPYPRDEGELRAIEGYVDASRAARDECAALVHPLRAEQDTLRLYELAPNGPTKLWLDDHLVLSTDAAPGAVLGQGVSFPAQLAAGEHRLTVLTCPANGRAGFYLIER